MRPTILDLKTGKVEKDTSKTENGVFWWTEGNGSCDCGRAWMFGADDEMDAEKHKELPDLKSWQSVCFGGKRFIVIDAEGDLEGETKEEVIRMCNEEYWLRLSGQFGA